ncbi:MAG: PQQ-binding-like beta-propeller repeat protein [Phycisphaerae bacterium]|nr:PQQ-binding-like beta-propeller repeat protein [Phycisphaerae bacterium]
MKNVIISVFLMLVALATCAHGAELLVPSQYPTIQSAINAAVNGDTVLVAPGIYTGTGNYNIDFLRKAITVRSENGPENCIIDCGGLGLGFYFHNNEDANSVLDGFTITNGSSFYGGGIYCSWSSPTITNCILSGNTADVGGGICCDSGRPMITGCTITGNTATYGGGIYCDNSSPTITNCIITGNTAGICGGGIYSTNNKPIVVSCTIADNSAGINGGGTFGCSGLIANCIIWGNSGGEYPQLYDSVEPIYSCIQDWAGTGIGNIDADPCFVGSGDYHLLFNSPCIDAGSPLYKALGLTDIDGQPRVIGTCIDMGADEYGKMIVVTEPVQGEVWATGSKRKIKWTQFGVGSVDILLSTNAGGNWRTIAHGITNANSYLWRIPNHIDSNQCVISILPGDGDVNVISVDSELFTIKPYPHRPPVPFGWLRKGLLPSPDLSDNKGPLLGCVKWVFDTNGPVSSQVAVARSGHHGGMIYVGCEDGFLYAINNDGELLWSSDINTPIVGSPAVGYYGIVYVAGQNGWLYAIEDGDVRWTQTTDAPVYSAPVVGCSGKIYVSSEDGLIYAFGADGSDLWAFETKGPGRLNGAVLTTPVIERNGAVYAGGFYDPNLYALDANTGSVKWNCPFASACDPNSSRAARLFATPAVGPDGAIYQTLINDPNLYAIAPCTGNIIWSTYLQPCPGYYCATDNQPCCWAMNRYLTLPVSERTIYDVNRFCPENWFGVYIFEWLKYVSSSNWSSPAVGPDGTIYVSFDDPYLRAVNPDGTIKWITRLGMVGGFTLTVDRDSFIYAASDDGYVCVVNADGEEVSRFEGDGWVTFPAIAEDGTLVVSDSNNRVWAISSRGCGGQPPALHWPADIQPSWAVDFMDFALLANNWLGCTDIDDESYGEVIPGDVTYAPGDIDRDLYVDYWDIAEMADNWLMGTNQCVEKHTPWRGQRNHRYHRFIGR